LSKIEVNTVDVQCGSTLTLGSSGKTVTLATGASQTGFGRTGTVNWCTTAKTSPLTVASGNGYFINTSGGAVTVTLPASPSAGDIVAFKDYANTWDDACKAVTVARNGSKINGQCACATLNTESQSVTLIYVDGTKGWQDIHDSTSNVTGNPGFTVASGGTETTSGDFKIHTFTASGPLNITNVGTPGGGTDKVSYMVVGGGGSGGAGCGGGAGAGGFREAKVPSDPYTDSPLDAGTGLAVSIQDYTITVGAGGTGTPLSGPYQPGSTGSVSTFSTVTSAGGGGGGGGPNPAGVDGLAGGSGGGANPQGSGGAGNTPPVSPSQGFAGGNGNNSGGNAGGGGGGASAVGSVGAGGSAGGSGGAGVTTSITASPVQRAGGGGAAWSNGSSGCNQGAGGGGKGGYPGGNADAGTANTGGGGGAGGIGPVPSGAGGSGIVVVRYKFQ
tara:strand:- start:5745 stop:7073 length:1329 start_codon:yes stop_codon:yes gene_type:complete